MTLINDSEQIFPRPLSGEKLSRLPSALVPERTVIKGRFVDLEPQDASKHAEELFQAGHGSEVGLKIWDWPADKRASSMLMHKMV